MDFQLSDDQELIRTAVRKICADYPDEYWAEKDEKHEFPWDFYNVMEMVKDRLGANPLPIVIPIGSGEMFTGIIDLLSMKAILYNESTLGSRFDTADIPHDMLEIAEKWRKHLKIKLRSKEQLQVVVKVVSWLILNLVYVFCQVLRLIPSH